MPRPIKPGAVASKPAAHSPLPWAVGGHPRDKSGSDWREITYQSEFGTTYMGQALKEDAALIVTAVNSHAALVNAVKWALAASKQELKDSGGMNVYAKTDIEHYEAALKLAGEEI
jgi:hypothetical protein